MTRSTTAMLLVSLCAVQFTMGQTRTTETRESVQHARGDTTVTESVVVSSSEDITPYRGMVVVNPLKFFLFYNLTFFYRVSPSVAVGGGIQLPTLHDVDGWGLNAEVRLYPSRRSLRGFYVAPNITYNNVRSATAEAEPFSIGAVVGWQWFPGEDFAIGLGLGADYYTGPYRSDEGEIGKFSGWAPALRFDIGYAW